MNGESLERKIARIGSPVHMLRNAPQGAYEFPMPAEYSNWRDEQRAWRTTAVLFNQSFHMTDIYFKGPDVGRLFSDLGVNSFATFGKNKAKQFVAVNADGRVIGDAILFGLADDEFSLVGRPSAPNWAAYQAEAGGYDVTVTRDERSVANAGRRRTFRYQLQGPNALKVIDRAADGGIPRIKFFNIGEFTVAGHPVRALNHTMVGAPGVEHTGLELWGPAEHGDDVLAALLAAGEEFGLRQGGARAYGTTALESGWIAAPVPAIYSGASMKPYREYLSAGELGGVRLAGRQLRLWQHRRLLPDALGPRLRSPRQVRPRLPRAPGAGKAGRRLAPEEGLAALARRGRPAGDLEQPVREGRRARQVPGHPGLQLRDAAVRRRPGGEPAGGDGPVHGLHG